MRDYSYQDMLKMQEDAANRVREMKRRATVVLEDEGATKPEIALPDEVRHISYPVELPESCPQEQKTQPTEHHTGLIDLLTKDSDAILILALLLVLQSGEEQDQIISIALLYLLL